MQLLCVYVPLCLLFVAGNAAPLTWKMVDLTYAFDENASKYPIFKNFDMKLVMNGTLDNGVW